MRGVERGLDMELHLFLVGSVSSTWTVCLVGFLGGGWSSRNQRIWRPLLLSPKGNYGSFTRLNQSKWVTQILSRPHPFGLSLFERLLTNREKTCLQRRSWRLRSFFEDINFIANKNLVIRRTSHYLMIQLIQGVWAGKQTWSRTRSEDGLTQKTKNASYAD